VTVGRLTAKLRKVREDHEESEVENGELNLVPYLDIVTNVIMFLMMTTTFAAALADINVTAPTTAAAAGGPSAEQPKQDLNLTVQISEKGFTVGASGGILNNEKTGTLPTLPKAAKDYPYPELTALMRKIKEAPENSAAEETKVIINANPDITYETLVATMDAIRSDGPKVLFPDVLLSAGVQ